MPMVENEAMGVFGAGGGIAGGGEGTEKTFAFPLVVFTEAGEGCWAESGSESGFLEVSESCPGRFCCGNSGVRVARVHDAEVVAVLRRAESSVMSGSLGVTSGELKDTGKLLWYSQWHLFR
jgi:hypothetical protein